MLCDLGVGVLWVCGCVVGVRVWCGVGVLRCRCVVCHLAVVWCGVDVLCVWGWHIHYTLSYIYI